MKTLASRRDLLFGAGALAAASTLPCFIHAALAQGKGNLASTLKGLEPAPFKIPAVSFKLGQAACAGPWGEVRIVRFGAVALPFRVLSANGLGLIEMATRRPFVQLGVGRADAITWTSQGVAVGRGARLEQWSVQVARKLRAAIKADKEKVRALMQLRSTLISAYPVYREATNTLTAPETAGELQRLGADLSTKKTTCSRQEIEEVVLRTEREIEEIWSTAAQQYEKCFDRETSGAKDLACSYLPAGDPRNACAITVCSAKTFVDVLVDTIESVRIVAEVVVKEAVVCTALAVQNALISTWSIAERGFPGLPGFGKPTQVLNATAKDKEAALSFLRQAAEAFGPFARQLAQSQWEVREKETARLTDGSEALVFDVSIYINALVAEGMSAGVVAAEFASTQVALITLLASVHAGFAVAVAAWGVVVPVALQASVSLLVPAVAMVVAVMVAMLLLVLAHGAMIVAQIEAAKQAGQFADGQARLEHMTLTIEQVRHELQYLLQAREQSVQQAADLFQPPVLVS